MDKIHLNFATHNAEQLYILKETLTSFHDILRATTIELWETNQHNPHKWSCSKT